MGNPKDQVAMLQHQEKKLIFTDQGIAVFVDICDRRSMRSIYT